MKKMLIAQFVVIAALGSAAFAADNQPSAAPSAAPAATSTPAPAPAKKEKKAKNKKAKADKKAKPAATK